MRATAHTIERGCPRCGHQLEALIARVGGRRVVRWIYCPCRHTCGYGLRVVTTPRRQPKVAEPRSVQLKLL